MLWPALNRREETGRPLPDMRRVTGPEQPISMIINLGLAVVVRDRTQRSHLPDDFLRLPRAAGG